MCVLARLSTEHVIVKSKFSDLVALCHIFRDLLHGTVNSFYFFFKHALGLQFSLKNGVLGSQANLGFYSPRSQAEGPTKKWSVAGRMRHFLPAGP